MKSGSGLKGEAAETMAAASSQSMVVGLELQLLGSRVADCRGGGGAASFDGERNLGTSILIVIPAAGVSSSRPSASAPRRVNRI